MKFRQPCFFQKITILRTSKNNLFPIRARGGGGAGRASAPPPPTHTHFFGNFKELLRKRCFQPPSPLPHFESLFSPPTFKVAPRALPIALHQSLLISSCGERRSLSSIFDGKIFEQLIKLLFDEN